MLITELPAAVSAALWLPALPPSPHRHLPTMPHSFSILNFRIHSDHPFVCILARCSIKVKIRLFIALLIGFINVCVTGTISWQKAKQQIAVKCGTVKLLCSSQMDIGVSSDNLFPDTAFGLFNKLLRCN